MIVASGYIEVDGSDGVDGVVNELKTRKIEVNEVEKLKVVFLVERDTLKAVKEELDSLRDINRVKSVHLAYYSLEGSDEGPDLEVKGTGEA